MLEVATPRTYLAQQQYNLYADCSQLLNWITATLNSNLTLKSVRVERFGALLVTLADGDDYRVAIRGDKFVTLSRFLSSRSRKVDAQLHLDFLALLVFLRGKCHQCRASAAADPFEAFERAAANGDTFITDPNVVAQSGLDRDIAVTCSEIDGLTMDTTAETTGVTTMLMEACNQVDVLGKHYVSRPLARTSPDIQNLTTYFARPVWVGTNASLPLGTRSLVVARPIFNTGTDCILDYFTGGSARLAGVYGYRYTMVWTLHVAANPFHQGILALNWQYGTTTTTSSTDFFRPGFSASCTNIPHARLDLSESTMCQLRIPFLAEEEFHRIARTGDVVQSLPYGTICVNTILPIAAVSGIVAPTYRLSIHLEDLELIGASPISSTSVVVQSGLAAETEAATVARPFSSGLAMAGAALKLISRGVPALSSVAGPAAWFLGAASGAAKYFGYSKPQIQEPAMRVLPVSSAFEHNVDQPSATVMVAPFASNSLRVGPDLANTDVDEMSLAYVLSQWSQVFVGSMSTSVASGQRLYVCPISPAALWFRESTSVDAGNLVFPLTTSNGTNSFLPSNLLFWSSLFRQWRGGMRFRFTFAKTKLHGGRVLAVFMPNQYHLTPTIAGTGIPTPPANIFAESIVFDLRDGSSFEFDVPYNPTVPFSDFVASVGTLVLYVQDPLQAPGVVSSSISFMVEVCAAPGFEVSVLRGVQFPASVGGTIRSQSGLGHISDDSCLTVVGERFTSAKQLIMMPKISSSVYYQVFDKWYTDVSGEPSVAAGTSRTPVTTWTMMPWWFHPVTNLPLTVAANPPLITSPFPVEAFTLSGNISKCYAFARGSTDVHVYANGTVSTGVTGRVTTGVPPTTTHLPLFISAGSYGYNPSNPVANTLTSYDSAVAGAPVVTASHDNVLHVRFPSYLSGARTRTHYFDTLSSWANMPFLGSVVTSVPNNTTAGSLTSSPVVHRVSITSPVVRDQTAVQVQVRASRCAGDDAQLGHYMGPPPMAIPNSNTLFTSWTTDNLLPILGGLVAGGTGSYAWVEAVGSPYWLAGSSNGTLVPSFPTALKAGPSAEGLISSTATVVESADA